MRKLIVAGVALIAVGAFIIFKGLSYGSERNTLSVGDIHISAQQDRVVPPWVGAVAIVGGLVLVGASLRGRRSV